MKVLITGGAGFIGYYITKELISSGDEVIIYDSFLNYIDPAQSKYQDYLKLRLKEIKNKVDLVKGDIRDKDIFLQELKKYKPEAIINLAALPISTVSNKYSEEAFEINLKGAVNVLESIRKVNFVDRFVHASSSMVYGDFEYIPADERHPLNPMDVYGGTKLASEILAKVYNKQYGINYTIIRPSTVYGPTDANRRVTQIFVENALTNKPLVLHNGGQSKLDFSYVEDVAHGFVLALKSKNAVNEVFNITNGQGRSLKELAEIIKKIVPDVEIKYKESPKDEKRPERGTLDISKAKKLLNYGPKYSLEEGMEKYVEFVKKSGVL
jgi:nucleoside-diphosphate-sugar epimerase